MLPPCYRTVSLNNHLVTGLLTMDEVVCRFRIYQNLNTQSGDVECFCRAFPHQMTVNFHTKDVEGRNHVVFGVSTPTKLLHANPRPCLNHRPSTYCDQPDLLCVRPHDKHRTWPGSHRNLCQERVFVFCWTVRVFEFLPGQKRARLRGELCALPVHRRVHKQSVLF